MSQGKLEQLAAPADLYANPATPFVAEFVGLNNKVPAEVSGGQAQLLGTSVPTLEGSIAAGPGLAMVRPESVTVSRRPGGHVDGQLGGVPRPDLAGVRHPAGWLGDQRPDGQFGGAGVLTGRIGDRRDRTDRRASREGRTLPDHPQVACQQIGSRLAAYEFADFVPAGPRRSADGPPCCSWTPCCAGRRPVHATASRSPGWTSAGSSTSRAISSPDSQCRPATVTVCSSGQASGGWPAPQCISHRTARRVGCRTCRRPPRRTCVHRTATSPTTTRYSVTPARALTARPGSTTIRGRGNRSARMPSPAHRR